MERTEWILCPVCENKTRVQMREDTILKNFPLYCPKCKQESLINCEIIDSSVFSVFDMLYKGYAKQRREYLKKHKRISEYDSENLLYAVIEEILQKEIFQKVGCVAHVSLTTLVKNYTLLDEEEKAYAQNPLTHVDFLLFNQMDKAPIIAIEVDGTSFHMAGSKQAKRDDKKDSIFLKCGIPLLRIRTNESGEEKRIENMLKMSI